jgi:site-specific recombinase XerD
MPFQKQAPAQFSAPTLSFIESERDRFRAAALARHTLSSYDRDLRVFRAWCHATHRQFLPATAETVQLYLVDMIHRGRKVVTVARHVYGIQHAHRILGLENPCNAEVRAVLTGAKRLLCQSPVQKTALTVPDLHKITAAIGEGTAIRSRNTAILLYGFATALRRSTLAALEYRDLRFLPQGVTAFIRHEKQDTTGEGRTVTIPFALDAKICPVHALKRWISWRGTSAGPLFQRIHHGKPTGQPILDSRIAVITKQAVAQIGLDPQTYSGHSLRAGFVTEAILAGVPDLQIMEHTGHRSLETLRKYFRPVYALRASPCHRIGL